MTSIYDVFADKSDYVLDQKMAQAALATPEQSRGVLPWLTEDPVIQVLNRPSPLVGEIRHNISQSSANTSLKTPPSALSDWDIVVKPNRREQQAFASFSAAVFSQ
ncbi:hypothetical protein EXIGLDRAFT_773155 [Exidia glandulosa HHB12029]|uniref:Uncharacterized protein n=1 Tax=Exidia glandulosa HHB12029 TaxID=1314781 RepID=A0A165EXW4_EXIGL|nr:hypothetical protein EXIGLDRAFT_773155 [Exidia glandulosa HHB12029]